MNVTNLLILMVLLALAATIAGCQGGCPCEGKSAASVGPPLERGITGFWQPRITHRQTY